jgi:exosortase K
MSAIRSIALKARPGARAALGWLLLYGAGCFVALGLKLFYSRAGSEELAWILAPTSALTELLTGSHFQREARTGWISHSSRMILGPACAGVNFLIIAFSAFFFSFAGRLKTAAGRCAWLPASLGGAYLLAIMTNALRIIAAIHLHDADIYGGLITPLRVHRAEGTMLYLASLLLAYLAVERAFVRRTAAPARRRAPAPLVPLGWYAAIALGVPLVNRAMSGGAGGPFLEHVALVLLVCLSLALVCLAPRIGDRSVEIAEGRGGRSETPQPRC